MANNCFMHYSGSEATLVLWRPIWHSGSVSWRNRASSVLGRFLIDR